LNWLAAQQRACSLPAHSWREGQFERLRSWRGGDDFPIHLKPKN